MLYLSIPLCNGVFNIPQQHVLDLFRIKKMKLLNKFSFHLVIKFVIKPHICVGHTQNHEYFRTVFLLKYANYKNV